MIQWIIRLWSSTMLGRWSTLFWSASFPFELSFAASSTANALVLTIRDVDEMLSRCPPASEKVSGWHKNSLQSQDALCSVRINSKGGSMRSILAAFIMSGFVFVYHALAQVPSPPTFAEELKKQRLEGPKPFVITPELYAKMDNYCKLYLDQEGEQHWREEIVKANKEGKRYFSELAPVLLKIKVDDKIQIIDLSTMDVQAPEDATVHIRPSSPVRYTFWNKCLGQFRRTLTGIRFYLNNPTPIRDWPPEIQANWD
jgi:hypothetical protein